MLDCYHRGEITKGWVHLVFKCELADYSIKILPPLPNGLFLGWIKRHNVTKMGLDVMLPTFGT